MSVQHRFAQSSHSVEFSSNHKKLRNKWHFNYPINGMLNLTLAVRVPISGSLKCQKRFFSPWTAHGRVELGLSGRKIHPYICVWVMNWNWNSSMYWARLQSTRAHSTTINWMLLNNKLRWQDVSGKYIQTCQRYQNLVTNFRHQNRSGENYELDDYLKSTW